MVVHGRRVVAGRELDEGGETSAPGAAERGRIVEEKREQRDRQPAHERGGKPAQEDGRHEGSHTMREIEHAVKEVATEHLVGALSGEHDLGVPARRAREQEGREGDGIAERLVGVPHDLGEQAQVLRPARDLVVLAPEPVRDGARGVRLVALEAEADRERLHRPAGEGTGLGGDQTRIEPAAQGTSRPARRSRGEDARSPRRAPERTRHTPPASGRAARRGAASTTARCASAPPSTRASDRAGACGCQRTWSPARARSGAPGSGRSTASAALATPRVRPGSTSSPSQRRAGRRPRAGKAA